MSPYALTLLGCQPSVARQGAGRWVVSARLRSKPFSQWWATCASWRPASKAGVRWRAAVRAHPSASLTSSAEWLERFEAGDGAADLHP
ncbi:hypothetical protein K7B10_36960 [Streptomyces flavotricini]|uniref:Uncharacterized protein n=1 Tax=Streptomyces flavotricini TaxID=66888 RepID=A0ABS8EGU2_9ACTN|nr:hypothetical protein [Streptomyces flavotricini]MCC0100275.1 hypothetical protein [Streptomyces flavotricini]